MRDPLRDCGVAVTGRAPHSSCMPNLNSTPNRSSLSTCPRTNCDNSEFFRWSPQRRKPAQSVSTTPKFRAPGQLRSGGRELAPATGVVGPFFFSKGFRAPQILGIMNVSWYRRTIRCLDMKGIEAEQMEARRAPEVIEMLKLMCAPLMTVLLLGAQTTDVNAQRVDGRRFSHQPVMACGGGMHVASVPVQRYRDYRGQVWRAYPQPRSVAAGVQTRGPVTTQAAAPLSGARRFSYDPTEAPVIDDSGIGAPMISPTTRPQRRMQQPSPPQVRLRPGSRN